MSKNNEKLPYLIKLTKRKFLVSDKKWDSVYLYYCYLRVNMDGNLNASLRFNDLDVHGNDSGMPNF